MHIVGPDVEEKRFRLMLLDKFDGLARNAIGYVFVHPERALPTFHIPDAGNAVHDGHIMSMTGF